ncbi:uncharacterized protein LOC125045310 [Penaeus chinensis]|uniref:uncharacterized protein LOC125045310 n=1 Tax=Penaeus chinensis TaxID=139456 RepID=UPI001FB59CF7|nr:uncharacterized protein LOC125045310 [Penaeus chinensis]
MKFAANIIVLSVVCCASVSTGFEKLKDEPELNAKFFVKSYSTRTWTFVSSFTSTVFYTCYTSEEADFVACQGRKLRRSRKLDIPLGEVDDELSSSLAEAEEKQDTAEKLFFTVWSTSSTTVTVTTFSTNRSVTVSVRILCTYPGVMFNVC